jgi:uncharacterized protein involved in cysteine biosynthesis
MFYYFFHEPADILAKLVDVIRYNTKRLVREKPKWIEHIINFLLGMFIGFIGWEILYFLSTSQMIGWECWECPACQWKIKFKQDQCDRCLTDIGWTK